ncbi:MAG: DUF72 domain-containing protein [Candidatus Binataceae bacterium]
MIASTPQFLVGTASWTDPSLVKSDLFYPPGVKTAEARLKFYAAHFPTVEVDSSYYALPSERNAQLWAERAPDDFIFNIKAFALLTRHAADTARLPKAIKEILPRDQRAARRIKDPPAEVIDLAFAMFWSALKPLRDAGKLGKLLFQFPPYFTSRADNLDYIAALTHRMPGAEVAVEFRHPSWLIEGRRRADTMNFLRAHGLAFVSVDAPAGSTLVPSFLDATGPDAYVRFHGRNRDNWFKRDIEVAERYKYLYSERELDEWAGRLKRLKDVSRAFVIFNNCYRNFGIMNASTMSQMMSH